MQNVKESVRDNSLIQGNWPVSLKSKINWLILAHVFFFALDTVFQWIEAQSGFNPGIVQFVNENLIISFRIDNTLRFHVISIFTYHFIHTGFIELVFNMVVLGFAGHLLAKQIGERKVVAWYFIGTLVSAIIFVLSHMVFSVLSGNAVMIGSQGGVLTVVTIMATHYRMSYVGLFNRYIIVWKLWILILSFSFFIHYSNTIAYYFVVVGSIYLGINSLVWPKYSPVPGLILNRQRIKGSSNIHT